ncbi:MAG: hypothetical protein KBB11_06855 [Bacteroidales bacterium]|nr:hypothetical protein [Bacteroidales bacterium]HOY38017.1 hypothetical protein [Bacteroidales bacterium]HQP05082.1 hypothetical protein [Bacteroidales bacterium]
MRKIYLILTMFALSLMALAQQNRPDQIPYQRFDSLKYTDGITQINVYVHLDCGRCKDAVELYETAGIPFKIIDLDNEENNVVLDKKITASISVADRGKGYSVRYPVIEINNDVYFCIENHYYFNQALVRYFERQKKK